MQPSTQVAEEFAPIRAARRVLGHGDLPPLGMTRTDDVTDRSPPPPREKLPHAEGEGYEGSKASRVTGARARPRRTRGRTASRRHREWRHAPLRESPGRGRGAASC